MRFPKLARSGSAILIVLGVIAVLFVSFGVFLKISVSSKNTTKRLNSILLARELSLSLATFAAHHLGAKEVNNSGGLLQKTLAMPLSQMPSETSEKIVFPAELNAPIKSVIESNSELRNLSYSLSWQLRKADFRPLLASYSREKKGQIRILVVVYYKAPGTDTTIREDYQYKADVTVAANIVPVLSKFTLYVQDALDGEPKDRFNKVSTDVSGNLNGGSFRPWKLKNSDATDAPDRFDELVKSPVGLVYLGGGSIVLGLARGWRSPGQFSEGFQFYNEGKSPSLYTVMWHGFSALLFWEAGLCNDQSDPDGRLWFDLIKEGFEKEARYNSAFRLLGTDQEKSPTLVLGDVFARIQCTKVFKSKQSANILPFAGSDSTFNQLKSGGASREKDISFLISQVGEMSRAQYNAKYASQIWDVPYNRGLGHIIGKHKYPLPQAAPEIVAADSITSFVTGDAAKTGLAHKVPQPFANLVPGADLRAMNRFLGSMMIPNGRNAWEIDLGTSRSLMTELEDKGFLRNGYLDLNGWLYVKGGSGASFDKPLKLKTHGGIVFETGSVTISQSIISESKTHILNLVAMNGDIIISQNLSGDLDIGLTAKGQVVVKGASGGSTVKINGNVAMGKIKAGSLDSSMARGLDINYFPGLAAVPGASSSEPDSQPVLMYAIDRFPGLID